MWTRNISNLPNVLSAIPGRNAGQHGRWPQHGWTSWHASGLESTAHARRRTIPAGRTDARPSPGTDPHAAGRASPRSAATTTDGLPQLQSHDGRFFGTSTAREPGLLQPGTRRRWTTAATTSQWTAPVEHGRPSTAAAEPEPVPEPDGRTPRTMATDGRWRWWTSGGRSRRRWS